MSNTHFLHGVVAQHVTKKKKKKKKKDVLKNLNKKK
jgi:hypothetical protein